MAEFKIDGRMTVRTLKENFKKEFEGTLRVYNGREKADDSATLAAIRTGDVKGGELICRSSRTVGKFEQEMMEVFGIKVQVASPDDWVLALDGITLANLKNIPKQARKADMESLVAYKRTKNEAETETNDAVPTGKDKSSNTFKVVLRVNASAIEILKVNLDELNLDTLDEDEASELLGGNHFVSLTNIDIDKGDNNFELKVYDEDDKLIYESDDFSDLSFVYDGLWMAPGNEEYEEDRWSQRSSTDWRTIKKISEELWKKEQAEFGEGYYLVGKYEHENDQTYTFTVEDDEFDPRKLVIISDKKLEGVEFEFSSDPNHILYGEKFVSVQLQEEEDVEYSYKEFSIMHRDADGSWEEHHWIG